MPPDGIVLRVSPDGRIRAARRHRGHETPLPEGAAIPAGRQILALPEGYLLERRIELPLAVAREARAVVELDFDRLTPFAAAQCWWSLEPLGEDPARGMAGWNLGILPRARVAEALDRLTAAGWRPVEAECARAEGGVRRLALGRAAFDRQRWVLRGALILLALLVPAAPFLRQSIQAGRIEDRIAAVQDQASVATRMLQRLAPGQGAGDALRAAQRQRAQALRVLAAITRALPDDTDLVSLSLQDGRLSMEGTSASAARLIGVLAAEPLIQSPSFSSPVTRTADGKDAFTITAGIGDAP